MEEKTKEELLNELASLRQRLSESEKALEAVRASEAIYFTAFNAANDAIIICDIETGRIIYANQRMCEMHCCSSEEALKMSVYDFTPGEGPYTSEKITAILRKAGEGEPQIFEWLSRDKAGRLFWVEVNVRRAIIGGKYRLLAVTRDITERKEMEEALKESEGRYRLAADYMPIHLAAVDRSGKFILWNKYSESMFGYTKDEVIGKMTPVSVHETKEDADEVIRVASETGIYDRHANLKHKDGHLIPVHLVVIPYRNGKGEIVAFYGFGEDITERKAAEEAAARHEYQLEILSRTSQHINAILDIPVILRTLMASAVELVGAEGGAAGLLINQKLVFTEYNRGGKIVPIDYTFEQGQGVAGWVLSTLKPYIANNAEDDPKVVQKIRKEIGFHSLANVPILNRKGEMLGCLEIYDKAKGEPFDAQDIFMLQGLAASAAVALENAKLLAELQHSEEMLKKSETHYRAVVEDQTELICRFRPNGILTFVNDAYCRYFGKTREELIGKSFFSLIPEEDRDGVNKNISTLSMAKPIMMHEHKAISANGQIRWQQWTNHAIFDEKGHFVEYQAVGRDVTEKKIDEEELELLNKELLKFNKRLQQLALKDTQTGLYNHHYLTEVMEPEFYRARRYGHPLSVIMLDIDYFKSINDVYGHEFGDLVLKQFAAQLRKMVRKYDIVVRFGGEEFIIISPGTERPKALLQAQRLLDAMNLYNFGDRKRVVKIKLSIGVASYPDDSIARGMDLINIADKILDKVKADGGNRVYTSLDAKKRKTIMLEEALEPTDVRALKEKIEKLTRQGKQSLIQSIYAFAKTIELKDHDTGKHGEKTVHYATEIAMILRLPQEDIENIKEAAILHDLGKIGVSDKILLKKGKLTKKEFDQIKKHPQIAADIMRPIQFMHDIIPLILYHHERWDGKGYPAGLKGDEIPIGARIISVADAFEALISNRPYRKAYPKNKAVEIVKGGSGTQFDPRVVDAFLKIVKKEK